MLTPVLPNHSHHSTGIIFNTRGLVGAVLRVSTCEHLRCLPPPLQTIPIIARVLFLIPAPRCVYREWLARENAINLVTLRRGNRDYEGCNHALCPDVKVYRCFTSLWVVIVRMFYVIVVVSIPYQQSKHKGRLPQNCKETVWASAR